MQPEPTVHGEFIKPGTSEKDIAEEVNRRTAKAGLTTKYGECRRATKIQTSVTRGKQKLNVWPRDEQGNLIP